MTIYFVQAGESGPVKIGFAENVAKRISGLQTGCPSRLRLLGVIAGGLDVERLLHRRFAIKRTNGEWFDLAPDDLDGLGLTVIPLPRRRCCPTSDFIDALGGTAAVARIVGVGTSAVSNWRKFDRLPPRLYLRLAAAARERGVEAPEALFQERRADEPEAA